MKTPPLSETSRQSERVVQAQFEAYNARDLDAWLATYSEDAEQFLLHGGSLAQGHAAIRQRMADRFEDPNLHATLLHRIVMEHTVVDHERVTRTFPDGLADIDMICVYEVADGRIQKATFAIGQARPRGAA